MVAHLRLNWAIGKQEFRAASHADSLQRVPERLISALCSSQKPNTWMPFFWPYLDSRLLPRRRFGAGPRTIRCFVQAQNAAR